MKTEKQVKELIEKAVQQALVEKEKEHSLNEGFRSVYDRIESNHNYLLDRIGDIDREIWKLKEKIDELEGKNKKKHLVEG